MNKRKLTNIMVTGGSGFIGTNFIRHLLTETQSTCKIINVDLLTYAGNPYNLKDIDEKFGGERYFFEKADICDTEAIQKIFEQYQIDTVIHFAAESHVDRSILGPREFIRTNINGTFNLLDVAREIWKNTQGVLFHHVSTDEVFGSLGDTGYFTETTPYDPKSPYSASKASSDHLVRAIGHTYDLPYTLSNCSNNYGPFQFPEKLIPLMIMKIIAKEPLPVYGDGMNIRDWLYVADHSRAIWKIVNQGESGTTYNIGGENEWTNIDLINVLCEKTAQLTGNDPADYKKLITFVKDRPGHDRRYAIDCGKIKRELNWKPETDFPEGIELTVGWYLDNAAWTRQIQTGEYLQWISRNYGKR